MNDPIICFGQQPCGFFPRRFLYAKLVTARRLREELGGEIVFFLHDSDHDPRETQTVLTHRASGQRKPLNFAFANKVQRKWSPACCKRVLPEWPGNTARQLPAYVDPPAVAVFKQATGANVADFCLDVYRRMGLLEGIRIERSGDPAVRSAACDVPDYFVDGAHDGETVRARCREGTLTLHEGGDAFVTLPPPPHFSKAQISPTRDTRLRWMQSVVRCTHYVAGAGEMQYLHPEEAPEIVFVPRDPIERADEAFVDLPA